MNINIDREYQKFEKNYLFNKRLALGTKKPHLARWAYGACREWIKDFEKSVLELKTKRIYTSAISTRKFDLSNLKEELKQRFSDYKFVGLIS